MEENMIIDPLQNWANTICAHDVHPCVCEHAMCSPCQSEPEVVVDVSNTAVFFLEVDHQAWPLSLMDGYSTIGFRYVSNGGLEARWEPVNNKAHC